MRVPPDQSATASAARATAASGSLAAQLVRDARQAGAERERLDPAARRHRGLQVLHEHPRVRLHRPRHVADQHQRPRALGALAPAPLDRLAAVAQRRAHRAAQVVARAGRPRAAPARRAGSAATAAAVRARPAARSARARRSRSASRVVGEVLLAQQLDLAPGDGRGSASNSVGAPVGRPVRRHRRRARQHQLGQVQLLRACSARGRRDRPARRSTRRTRRRTPPGRRGASRARCAVRCTQSHARRRIDRGQRAVRGQQLADAHAHPAGTQRRGQQAEPPHDPGAERLACASDTLEHPIAPYPVDVLAHLQGHAQRRLQVVVVQREQRLRPGDRLAHARQLVELLRRAAGRRPRRRARRSRRARRARRACTIAASRTDRGSRSSGRGSGA